MLKLNNNGDTIIEVLIAMVILGMAFTISYSVASAALIKTQNTQEHSLALEYLDSQVEGLRALVTSGKQVPTDSLNPYFCVVTPSSPGQLTYFTGSLNKVEQNCTAQVGGAHYQWYDIESSTNNYTFTIDWQGLGRSGNDLQQEQLYYRVYSDD